ncbi:MAG: transposase, partial [Bacilli bacterium]
MSKNKYNNDIYTMYEKETLKNQKITSKYNKLRWEVEELRYDNKKLNNELSNINSIKEKEINKEVEKITKPLLAENQKLQEDLLKAYDEINRLKGIINNNKIDKDYLIDKLNNQVNKNSTNSGIPTSKEIANKNKKTGANTYNHRTTTSRKNGGQFNHKGSTLTKEKLEEKIKQNNIEVREFIHYINGNLNDKEIIKYRTGIETKIYVEKHIFRSSPDTSEKLPKPFYSDVTYNDDLKALIVSLGNYFSIPYNKIKELIFDLTNGVIDISEGTIDNIYEEFSNKTDDTLNNITNNILNGTYQHTDETVTKENGKDTYYRGYANKENVLYKYHQHKGDTPIEKDGILNNYYGTIISDHDTGIFKYGTNNQDCIIHFGRYCIEKEQNIDNVSWPIELYRLLLKFEVNRKILSKFGRKEFTEEEIEIMEKEFDNILSRAKKENEYILSTYWKEKCNTLLNRCIKYKKNMLFYIHDFTVPYDNNFMERALRMIKGKTKVSGGFRSKNGAIRFGKTMSIIKTAKLRKMNPFECIKAIFE